MAKIILPKLYQNLKESKINFNAGWRIFRFEFYNSLINESGEILHGETDFNHGIIKLAGTVNKIKIDNTNAKTTLFHELFHIITDTVGLGLEHEIDGIIPPISNERLVDVLSKAMLTYKNINPKIFWLLFGEENEDN